MNPVMDVRQWPLRGFANVKGLQPVRPTGESEFSMTWIFSY